MASIPGSYRFRGSTADSHVLKIVRFSVVAIGTFAVAAVWYACIIYDSSLLTSSEAGADVATTPDAGEGGAMNDGCISALPPARPTTDDPSDADIELDFAVRAFIFDGVDGAPPPLLGYNLDGLCTCPDPPACASTVAHCDDPGGIDNGGAQLLRNFESLSGGVLFSQQVIDDDLDGGVFGMLVRVRNYNGTPNDTQVELSTFIADGVVAPDGGPSTPQWNGSDSWAVDMSGVFGSGMPIVPLHYDAAAYVSGGVLVGHFDYPLPLGFSDVDRLDVLLTQGFVTGTLTPSGPGFRIDDGMAGGRWAVSDALQQLAYVHDPANSNNYFCPSSPTYPQIKAVLCPALDLTVDPTAPLTATCDALSFTLGFSAVPAQLGPVEQQPRPTTCADAGPYTCP